MPDRPTQYLATLPYSPPGGYRLDLEIIAVSELRRRGSAAHFRTPQRVGFHLLIGVTAGRFRHMVDFVQHECAPGNWIVLRPGQVQRYDMDATWDGWLVVFRPEFLLPLSGAAALDEVRAHASLAALPDVLALTPGQHGACLEGILRMGRDAACDIETNVRSRLLRHQLYTLLLRLHLAAAEGQPADREASHQLRRFQRFRQAVEAGFAQEHSLAGYARRLGCSEKSLTRAALAAAGVSAKTFLSRRIVLEAKRLLAHTGAPIAAIALQTGFEEASNFVKFFRREAGCTPGEFRRRQQTPDTAAP